MITREEALKFLDENIENKNIIKHLLCTEAMMRVLAKKIKNEEIINEDQWALAGLLHDGDYKPDIPVEKQGIEVTNILRQKGYEIPEAVAYCMAAHNWENTKVEPKSQMDWALFCGDSLTGLIVATALVRPDKKLSSVEVKSVLKKFKDKFFAQGARREDIKLCEEKLGIKLEDFIGIVLSAMQGIADEIRL